MLKLNLFTILGSIFLAMPAVSRADFISIYASKSARSIDFDANRIARLKVSLGNSAYDAQRPLSNVNLNEIPEWNNWEQLKSGFDLILNERNLDDHEVSGFQRRITWLYRNDGCFTRSGLASKKLARAGFPKVKQFFVFSDLRYWTYHVALAARIGSTIYIFDPAFNWNEPMPLDAWRQEFTYNSDPENVAVSICDQTSWDPGGDCAGLPPDHIDTETNRNLDQWRYVWQHEERESLANKAPLYLGDFPPWKKKDN